MKNKKLILIIILAAAAIIIISSLSFTGLLTSDQVVVKRVIDGDTIELQDGERVRLLGIDTPEKGQYLYKESTEWLRDLIEKKPVTLESDVTNRDKYDRFLRHVYFEDIHVNLELVKTGYARQLIISPDERYSQEINEAENYARENNLGVWKYAHIPDVFCVGINQFRYNAQGNDNENLNDEFVVFRNSCTYPVSLGGWVIKDRADNTYTFSDFILANKTAVALHTGEGEDNDTDVYWSKNRAIWNNDADVLKAWDGKGNLVLDYEYKNQYYSAPKK